MYHAVGSVLANIMVPKSAVVSCTSNIPLNVDNLDIGNPSGPHIADALRVHGVCTVSMFRILIPGMSYGPLVWTLAVVQGI